LCIGACSRPPLHAAFSDQPAEPGNNYLLQKFQPRIERVLYDATVDVVGRHLSGILLIKKMPDSSIRLVFTNEMGMSFFDFEYPADGGFVVHSIMKKMNKKAVKKTLQHDFELVLMNRLDDKNAGLKYAGGELYHIYPQGKGFHYYITDSTNRSLIKMQRASQKKIIVNALMRDYQDGVPDTIGISHTGFEFNIGLKRIQDELNTAP
jgi:hypothetical protein